MRFVLDLWPETDDGTQPTASEALRLAIRSIRGNGEYLAWDVLDDVSGEVIAENLILNEPAPSTTLPDDDELAAAVLAVQRAAYGDSNDGEIEALADALSIALRRLNVTVRDLTDDEIEALENQ